jgi:hypothetical protein
MGGIAHMKPIIDHVKKERGAENVLLLRLLEIHGKEQLLH